MFRGQYEHSIDVKGRTSLPVRFRDVLTAQNDLRLVMTMSLDPCLVLYPYAEWLAFEDRLSRASQFDPSVTLIRRLYVSSAIECEVDSHGRLIVPSNLREHAQLERDALWAGMGKTIELWSKPNFNAMRAQVLSDDARRLEIARRLSELGV